MKDFKVFEDNAGGISLATFDQNGHCDYAVWGYEYRSHTALLEDINAIKDGADPALDGWDTTCADEVISADDNDISNYDELFEDLSNGTNLIADQDGVYFELMGVEGKRLFKAIASIEDLVKYYDYELTEEVGISPEQRNVFIDFIAKQGVKYPTEFYESLIRRLYYNEKNLTNQDITEFEKLLYSNDDIIATKYWFVSLDGTHKIIASDFEENIGYEFPIDENGFVRLSPDGSAGNIDMYKIDVISQAKNTAHFLSELGCLQSLNELIHNNPENMITLNQNHKKDMCWLHTKLTEYDPTTSNEKMQNKELRSILGMAENWLSEEAYLDGDSGMLDGVINNSLKTVSNNLDNNKEKKHSDRGTNFSL